MIGGRLRRGAQARRRVSLTAFVLVAVAAWSLAAAGLAQAYVGNPPFLVQMEGPNGPVSCDSQPEVTATLRDYDSGQLAVGQPVFWDVKVDQAAEDRVSPTQASTNSQGKVSTTVHFAQANGVRTIRLRVEEDPEAWEAVIDVSCNDARPTPTPTATPTPTPTPTPTRRPTATPTDDPTDGPTDDPTATPLDTPATATPTATSPTAPPESANPTPTEGATPTAVATPTVGATPTAAPSTAAATATPDVGAPPPTAPASAAPAAPGAAEAPSILNAASLGVLALVGIGLAVLGLLFVRRR